MVKKITRKQFEDMYYNTPVHVMCKQLNVSSTTIYNIIKDMKIKKKGKKRVWKKLIVED